MCQLNNHYCILPSIQRADSTTNIASFVSTCRLKIICISLISMYKLKTTWYPFQHSNLTMSHTLKPCTISFNLRGFHGATDVACQQGMLMLSDTLWNAYALIIETIFVSNLHWFSQFFSLWIFFSTFSPLLIIMHVANNFAFSFLNSNSNTSI